MIVAAASSLHTVGGFRLIFHASRAIPFFIPSFLTGDYHHLFIFSVLALIRCLASCQFVAQMDLEWGFVLDEGLAAVLVSELGPCRLDDKLGMAWFLRACSYLKDRDVDFCFSALDAPTLTTAAAAAAAAAASGGRRREGGGGGILTADWRPNWGDDRVHALRMLTGAQLPADAAVL